MKKQNALSKLIAAAKGVAVGFIGLMVFGAAMEAASDLLDIEPSPVHLYDDATVCDVRNGSGNSIIGQYSYVMCTSDEVTDEVLADWYFNYVVEHKDEYSYCLLVYTDAGGTMGTWANGTGLARDCAIVADRNGSLGSSNIDGVTTLYLPRDGELGESHVFSEDA